MFKRKLLALATAAVLTAVTICASVQATEDQGVTSTEQTELSEDEEEVATDGDISEEPSEDFGDEDFGDEDFGDEDLGDEDFEEEDEEVATDGDISEEPSEDEEDGDSSEETPDEWKDWQETIVTEFGFPEGISSKENEAFYAASVENILTNFNDKVGKQPLFTLDLTKVKQTDKYDSWSSCTERYREDMLNTIDSSKVTGELEGIYVTMSEASYGDDRDNSPVMVMHHMSDQLNFIQSSGGITNMTVAVPNAKVGDTVTVVTWDITEKDAFGYDMFGFAVCKNSEKYHTITVTKDGQVDISGYGCFPFAVYLDKAEAVVTPTPEAPTPETTVTPAPEAPTPEASTPGNTGSNDNAGTTGGSVSGIIQTGTSMEVVSTLTSTVIAAPSTEAEEAQFQNALVNNVKAADASGNDLAVTCIALTTYNQTVANTLIATVNASKVSGNLASLYEVNYNWDTYSYEEIQGKDVDKVTLTIPVADVKAGDEVTVVHWLAKSTPEGAVLTGEVEYVKPSAVNNGEIVVTLKGLSPVAVYVDKDAASNAQTGSTAVTSPKTGNSDMGLVLAVLGAALMLVVTVFGKKTVR